MVANHTGLVHEGVYLDEPSAENSIELVLLEEWSTDDDTMVEWVYLHLLETHGLEPTYEQIRDEWVEHINHDIWVSARRARDLMDEGIAPPETSDPALNPLGLNPAALSLGPKPFLLSLGPSRLAQLAHEPAGLCDQALDLTFHLSGAFSHWASPGLCA